MGVELLGAAIVVIVLGVWRLSRLRHLDPMDVDGEPVGQVVSVVIPARDEAGSLPNLLATLAVQLRPADEVVVVDDDSTDGTGDLARRFGATVVTAPPRPEGWLGKPWACSVGAQAATGDLLVFLDADVTLAPDAVGRLLATHRRDPDGLLSVQPHHDAPRWWEQLSALPNLVAAMASGALDRGDRHPAVAFGPCLVTSRRSYERAGTHAVVADEVIEDIHLARAYDGAGLGVTGCIGGESVRFRMYPAGVAQLVDGWTKNLAGGPGLAPLGPLVLAVIWLLGVSSVVGAIAAVPFGRDPWPVAAAWVATAATVSWMLGRIGSFRWWAGPAFPVLWVAFVGLFARSAIYRATGRVRWRGRVIATGGR